MRPSTSSARRSNGRRSSVAATALRRAGIDAVESAVELARPPRDLPDHARAFAASERARHARVERITASGRRIDHAESPGPAAAAFMRALMPLFSKRVIEKTSGPPPRLRIDSDAPMPGSGGGR
jgi:hypothetical protein